MRIDTIKNNVCSFIKENNLSQKKHPINTILQDILHLDNRQILFDFLNEFKLSLIDISSEDFKPYTIQKFRKANGVEVDSENIKLLKHIAELLRINDKIGFQDYTLEKDEALVKIFSQKIYNNFEKEITAITIGNLPEKEKKIKIGEAFKDLQKTIKEAFNFNVFFIEDKAMPFDGIYFNRPVATTFIKIYNKNYSETLFTLLHELYHFFRDDGTTPDAIDFVEIENMKNVINQEDIKANKYASSLLFYNKADEIKNLKPIDFIKKYPVSKMTYTIKTNKAIKEEGYFHQCFLKNDNAFIKKEIKALCDNEIISNRIADSLTSLL